MNAHVAPVHNAVPELIDEFQELRVAINILHHLTESNFGDICAFRKMGMLEDCETIEELLSFQSHHVQRLVAAFEAKMMVPS